MSNVILTEQQILENCVEDCFDGFKELCEELGDTNFLTGLVTLLTTGN